jgi:hypothetical protein
MAGALLVKTGDWADYLRFRDAFHGILDTAYYPADWLDCEVATGRFKLFTGEHSAILVSVKVFPSGLKELQGEAGVGKLAELVGDLIPAALNWARSIGCQSAQISSREGWVKQMRKHGFELYQTTIRRAL